MAATLEYLIKVQDRDLKDLKKELKDVQKEAGDTSGYKKHDGALSKLGGTAKIAAAAITGGLVVGLTKSIHAAVEAQVSNTKLDTVFKTLHTSLAEYTGRVDEAEKASRKLGFTDDDVRGSLSSLLIATHSYKESVKEMAVAQDLARFKGVSLEVATKALTMAHAGSTRALKQLGLVLPTVTAAQDAVKNAYKLHTGAAYDNAIATAKAADKANQMKDVISILTDKVHGQAAAFAGTASGGMAQFHAETTHIEEVIGGKLLPVLVSLITHLSTLLEWFSKHTTVAKVLVGILGAMYAATLLVAGAQGIITAATGAATAAQWLWNIAMDANPIGLVIIGLVALGVAIYLFRDKIKDVYDWLKDNWPLILGILLGPFALAVIEVAKHWDAIKGVITGAFGDIKTIVRDAMGDVKTIVINQFDNLFSLGETLGKKLYHGLDSGLTGIAGVAKDAVSGAIGAVLGYADNALSAGERVGHGIVNGMEAGIAGLGALFRNIGEGAGAAIVGALKAALNGVIHAINNLLRINIDVAIPFAPDFHFHWAANIPTLARGGIVNRPTLAMIGEAGPEAVVPLGRGGGFGNVTVYVAGSVISEGDLVDAIHRGLKAKQARNGSLGLA